ncbi:group II intron maturase-specific domain-containing protein [Paraburkholderia nemoris]|uniref:group II intron maturase-specific domain-containing protein n=1 Tax=Paraburkholderia nemoris TaxID=2793076 RepID=UPI0038BA249F
MDIAPPADRRGPSRSEIHAEQDKPVVLPATAGEPVRQFLAVRGLELSEEKTRVTHIADGFDFLGQNIRKYGGKLLIKPANKSVKALLEKVREIVRNNTSATQTNLILQLNPVIRGWAMCSHGRRHGCQRPGHQYSRSVATRRRGGCVR